MLPLSIWLFGDDEDSEVLTTLYSPDIPSVGDILRFISRTGQNFPNDWEVKKVRREYSVSGHFVRASVGVSLAKQL